MNTIGETIAALRKKRGFTQETLANLIGVSAQSVSKWENNTNMPDISLLPVLADIFQCRIDDLFGRGSIVKSNAPEQVLDRCCGDILTEIGSCVYGQSDQEEYLEKMAEYRKELKESDDQRSSVLCAHGFVYYREKLGALVLKRPEEGWMSLLEAEEAEGVFALLGDRDFRKALAEICRSHVFSFTLHSLCSRCGIEDEEALAGKLTASRLFWTKSIDVDGHTIPIYEMAGAERLTMLFAAFACALEYAEYRDSYACFFGCGKEELLKQPNEK